VRQAPQGLPQHLTGWQEVLARTYGYNTYYCVAWHGGNSCKLQAASCKPKASSQQPTASSRSIAGVMPLFVVQSPLLGRTLTTMPGGLCAEDETAAAALLAEGRALAQRVRAKRFVLHDTRQAWPGELETTCDHEHWLVDVRMGQDALWHKLDRNIRRQVRIAQRNGLVATVDRSGASIHDFYQVLSRFSHQAGTPVFGRSFLENIAAVFPQGFSIVMVYHAGQPIGGYFQLELGDTNYGVWGATLHEHLELRPVYLAYWEIMVDTIAQGFSWLDLGRSPAGSNASKYKGQWATGATSGAAPVYQQTVTLGQAQQATSVARQLKDDMRFRSVRQLWPRLPFGVAQLLGPHLRRHVPFA
jgi:hypothetical protein